MSIKVLSPGLLTSIQDLGRVGYQKHGVIVSGTMDAYALRVANLLVGNKEGEGVLEITLTGPTLEIPQGTLFSITGGDLSPTINGRPVPVWRPIYLKETSVLKFGASSKGCRAYLAVGGGYDIKAIMGSKSTYLKAGIGGYQGRALQKGDVLLLGNPSAETKCFVDFLQKKAGSCFAATRWYVPNQYIPTATFSVRVTRGGQFTKFSEESQTAFLQSTFQVTTRSDRMGYRLAGAELKLAQPLEMISEAVSFGTVQVPPDGNPIVLMADRQTAGGYPKIAQVIMVDLPVIAQSKPGSQVSFREISLKEAEQLYFVREQDIRRIKAAIALNLKE